MDMHGSKHKNNNSIHTITNNKTHTSKHRNQQIQLQPQRHQFNMNNNSNNKTQPAHTQITKRKNFKQQTSKHTINRKGETKQATESNKAFKTNFKQNSNITYAKEETYTTSGTSKHIKANRRTSFKHTNNKHNTSSNTQSTTIKSASVVTTSNTNTTQLIYTMRKQQNNTIKSHPLQQTEHETNANKQTFRIQHKRN